MLRTLLPCVIRQSSFPMQWLRTTLPLIPLQWRRTNPPLIPPAAATHDLASPAAASHHSGFQPPSAASHDSIAQPPHSPTQQAPMNPEDVPTHSPSTQTSSGSVLCFLSFNLSHLFSHVLCILDKITVQKLILELIIFVCYVLGS